jgi:hypothetical protein
VHRVAVGAAHRVEAPKALKKFHIFLSARGGSGGDPPEIIIATSQSPRCADLFGASSGGAYVILYV